MYRSSAIPALIGFSVNGSYQRLFFRFVFAAAAADAAHVYGGRRRACSRHGGVEAAAAGQRVAVDFGGRVIGTDDQRERLSLLVRRKRAGDRRGFRRGESRSLTGVSFRVLLTVFRGGAGEESRASRRCRSLPRRLGRRFRPLRHLGFSDIDHTLQVGHRLRWR